MPAAYALAIRPVKRWRDAMFFFISTKMLPIVAAIGPLYVIALHAHLLDRTPQDYADADWLYGDGVAAIPS